MIQSSQTFRIFVISKFSDLKAERNALQERVFSRSLELCMQHGYLFQAIYLRWGISEEATIDQQAMIICLEEVERCQQFVAIAELNYPPGRPLYVATNAV